MFGYLESVLVGYKIQGVEAEEMQVVWDAPFEYVPSLDLLGMFSDFQDELTIGC